MDDTRFQASETTGVATADQTMRTLLEAVPAAQVVPAPRDSEESVAGPRLVISRGPDAGTGFAIGGPSITIGRDRDCDIVVEDMTVSRVHAELRLRDGKYVVVDGGSLNGTYLNRQPVDIAELVDGDEIWIGRVRFTFRSGG
ncbi:FHA domain-containing protein [Saccharopolyspora kobensis]|uniref:FHA domain-containing protein n=1 Tax=Saccharopolyspora kobensis TaxID=146035 RepID=A0A1H6DS14_9PSEU|nr:FHA domain-containing protein [Saccharopolyspora kobensis]SEG88028.1 FHA domain-containing protein [Saccharopolyspora kobensis]SFE03550.1 Inner membrane component of T3SS domain-containing protein [Saccharopolyspora kobensis]